MQKWGSNSLVSMINIITVPEFDKDFKRLAKKYPSIGQDLKNLLPVLREHPVEGEPLGKDCYKIRLAISSNNKGKSGGARIITCVKIMKETVVLLSIYDKSSRGTISDKQLKQLLSDNDLL